MEERAMSNVLGVVIYSNQQYQHLLSQLGDFDDSWYSRYSAVANRIS